MIKDVSYAAYVYPVRENNGTKEFAVLRYPNGYTKYGALGGRLEPGDKDSRDNLRRELIEECGQCAAFLADDAIEIPVHEILDVAPERIKIRNAYKEDHTWFVVKLSKNTNLEFTEPTKPNVKIVWLPITQFLDDKICYTKEKRAYCERYILPVLEQI